MIPPIILLAFAVGVFIFERELWLVIVPGAFLGFLLGGVLGASQNGFLALMLGGVFAGIVADDWFKHGWRRRHGP